MRKRKESPILTPYTTLRRISARMMRRIATLQLLGLRALHAAAAAAAASLFLHSTLGEPGNRRSLLS